MSHKWRLFLQAVLETEEHESGCEECFERLDQYVELILEGGDPQQVMPVIKQHLDQCACCSEEFEALAAMLDALR